MRVGRKGTALVVDADSEVAALAMGALSAMGFATRVAPDGRLAVNAVRADVPDVLILDLQLPYMDGDQVLVEVAGLLKRKGTAIIVASAIYSPDHARVAEMQLLGACAFLEKPYLPIALCRAVMDAREREQRNSSRNIPPPIRVIYRKGNDGRAEGFLREATDSGIEVATSDPPKTGQSWVRIELDDKRTVIAVVMVLWARAAVGHGVQPGFGADIVRFVSAEHEAWYRRYVRGLG